MVTITGSNFLNVSSVAISGVTAQNFTVQSPTQIQAVVGRISTSGTVTVMATGGTVTSATQFVNVVLPPRISSIEPLTATAGTVLTIRGENLGEVNIITIGGVSMPTFRANGTDAISLALPPETQSGSVLVQSAGGADSSAQQLAFFGPPFVTGVVPPIASPSSLVTINGLNLNTVTDVRFGDVPVQNITVLSPTQIIVTIGNGATGLVRAQSPQGVGFSASEAQILPPVQVDSLALVSVYNTTGDRTWRNSTNWLRGEIRTWFGVTIENGRVAGVELPSNGLVGEIPGGVFALSQLRNLNLSGNNLTGVISPTISALRLGDNRLTGGLPDSIARLTALTVLDVRNNQLSGALPQIICSLPQIRALNVSRNSFVGRIPPCLAQTSTLTILDLSFNRFTGSIPRAIGDLPALEEFAASNNQLTGGLPSFGQALVTSAKANANDATAGALTLKRLDLSNNQIADSIPTAFAALTQLRELNLAHNLLFGTLPSRPVQVNFAPPPPVAAPQLLFPANGSSNISLAPLLQWTDVPNTNFYEVQVSLSDDFTILSTSATATITQVRITGLNNGVTYYWRVRARNAGGVGPWQRGAALFSFRTVDIGVQVALSSINFGRVAIGDSRRIRAAVANVGNQLVQFQSVSLVGDNGNVFASSADIAPGTPIAPGRDIPVDFIFTPKTTVTNTAGVVINYSLASGGQIQSSRFDTLLSGRGGALKLTTANFDTVRVGRVTLTNALIINNSNPQQAATIRSVALSDSAGGVFKPEDVTLTTIQPGDTATTLLRAEPNAVGGLQGRFRVVADIDSANDGGIAAVARLPRVDDLTLSVGVRALKDSAARGENVLLELFAAKDSATGQNTDLRRVLSQPANQLPPSFRAFFRFNKQTLTLNNDSNTTFAVTAIRNRASGSTPQTVLLPLRWYAPTPNADSAVLARMLFTAINGEVDFTQLRLERFVLGASGADSVPAGIRRVFVEVPRRAQNTSSALIGTFRVALCHAGGTRFVRQTNSTFLARSVPNPTSDGAEITYSLRESGFAKLELFDAAGKLVKTLFSTQHTSGEYTLFLPTTDLPSGTYFLTLTTPTQMATERLNVVK